MLANAVIMMTGKAGSTLVRPPQQRHAIELRHLEVRQEQIGPRRLEDLGARPAAWAARTRIPRASR
jgi:hypothetical protein